MDQDPGQGTGIFPDPVVSANLYCAGKLDPIISGPVRDAWGRYREDAEGADSYLWLMRYARRGEHLKVRFHGSESEGARFRALLDTHANDALGTFDGSPAPASQGVPGPPIDVEDGESEPHPDRSLLWTTYQRSFVSFGGKPLLDDEEYLARFTRCLGAGTELILSALASTDDGAFSHPLRRTTLWRALGAGLRALDLERPDGWASYLAYHRDWLIRFKVRGIDDAQGKSRQLLGRFQDRAQAGVIRGIAAMLETPDDPALTAWGERIRRLAAYVQTFEDRPEYQLEPFAPQLSFSPVFKVFHGLANQLGLTMLDEGLTHHLMLRAVSPDFEPSPDGVALVPNLPKSE